MKISTRQPQPRGIALFIVMVAIFVLSVMAAIFAASMKVETKLAINAEHNEQMLWLGRSGVELARYVLAQEAPLRYTALNQIWAGGPGSLEESNSPLQGIKLNNYKIGDGSVSVKIIDLDSFANINTAGPQMIQQALNLMGVGADNVSVISDSILDWINPGDNPRLAGAKSDYYQSLNPPYYCKDAPMDNKSELLLVRGIWNHPAIYWGGSVTNYMPAAFQQKFGRANSPYVPPNYPFGLKDIFTTISDGRININTAGKNVLQVALMTAGMNVDEAGTAADNIIQRRPGPGSVNGPGSINRPGNMDGFNGMDGFNSMDGLDNRKPFVAVGQLVQAGVPPPIAARLNQFCTTRSRTFEVDVTARVGDDHRKYVAILVCVPPNDPKVLSFYWK